MSGVREEIGYLSHLVDNLLDMSRVEREHCIPIANGMCWKN